MAKEAEHVKSSVKLERNNGQVFLDFKLDMRASESEFPNIIDTIIRALNEFKNRGTDEKNLSES